MTSIKIALASLKLAIRRQTDTQAAKDIFAAIDLLQSLVDDSPLCQKCQKCFGDGVAGPTDRNVCVMCFGTGIVEKRGLFAKK